MMGDKPDPATVKAPWVISDCECMDRFKSAPEGCETCDGWGWYYWNEETDSKVSEMMRDALERHG
jgi:hypothetical protein